MITCLFPSPRLRKPPMSIIRNASHYFRQRYTLIGLLCLFTISTNGCDGFWAASKQDIHNVQSQQQIRVVAVEGPLVYRQGKNQEKYGIDYDLIQSFAKDYNLKIKWLPVRSQQEATETLDHGQADIAVGRYHGSSKEARSFLVTPAIEETHLSLFCRKNQKIHTANDLSNKRVILFEKDLSLGPIELIKSRMNQNLGATVNFNVWMNSNVQTAFREIAVNNADCLVAENFESVFWLETFLTIEKIAPIGGSYSLNWLIHPTNNSLLNVLRAWFVSASRKDEINRVQDRYHLLVRELDENDVRTFLKKSRDTLPDFLKEIKKSSTENRLPWQLIAAVAYQESKWDPEARSYTGVRGIMQLTEETADLMGVEDRRDPAQSIQGGSKYIKYLYEKIPAHINSKDRLALTLAAYNIGYGHLLDAQKLTDSLGKNPESWKDLKTVLPLLTKEKYYSQTTFGYARGYETVQYVERTKSYYHLLVLRD